MDIKLLKELEDLKKELAKLREEYDKAFMVKKRQYFDNTRNEFKKFFTSQGFDVKETNNNDSSKILIATYKGSNITLKLPDINESYVGVYSIFNLNISTTNKRYIIRLNELGKFPRVIVSCFSNKISELSENERINQEIEDNKKRIDDLKTKLIELPNIKWGFELVEQDKNKKTSFFIQNLQYDNFETLLESLFK